MSDSKPYILGTDPTELERLGFQHRVWSADAARLWEIGKVQRGMHVLDIGAGPGFASFDLAEIVGGEGSVTAIDISEAYVNYGNEQAQKRGYNHVSFLQQSIHDLQINQKFDIIYCRWVLSWVNHVDEVISAISNLLKPEGVFLVQEYAQWGTFRIVPEIPAVRNMIEACRESWRVMPSEIDIAPQLPEMFYENGLHIEHKAMLEKVATPNDLVWQWPETFLNIYSEKLIAMNLLTRQEQNAFFDAWATLKLRKDAMVITPLMMEFAARKL